MILIYYQMRYGDRKGLCLWEVGDIQEANKILKYEGRCQHIILLDDNNNLIFSSWYYKLINENLTKSPIENFESWQESVCETCQNFEEEKCENSGCEKIEID